MLSITAARGMLQTDGIRLLRDRFLIGIGVYIIVISIALRWLLPWVAAEVDVRLAFDLTPYYPLAVSHFVVQLAGLLAGIIGGLLLLEGREDGTIKALLVSPVPLSVYVAVLCVVMGFASIVLTITEGAIIGLALPPWPALLGAAVAGAPAGAGLALFIATFADNKTEAFAWMKIVGLGPVAARWAAARSSSARESPASSKSAFHCFLIHARSKCISILR